jgi:hypothetical protein
MNAIALVDIDGAVEYPQLGAEHRILKTSA